MKNVKLNSEQQAALEKIKQGGTTSFSVMPEPENRPC